PGIGASPDIASMVPAQGQYDNLAYYQQAAAANQPLPIFGKTEPAVFDTKTGVFTILGPGGVYTVSGFQAGDIPAAGDYLGTGSDQLVAFRPGTGQFIQGNTNGQATTLATLGGGNIPITAPLPYRMPPVAASVGGGSGSGSGSGGTSTGGSGSGGTST